MDAVTGKGSVRMDVVLYNTPFYLYLSYGCGLIFVLVPGVGAVPLLVGALSDGRRCSVEQLKNLLFLIKKACARLRQRWRWLQLVVFWPLSAADSSAPRECGFRRVCTDYMHILA